MRAILLILPIALLAAACTKPAESTSTDAAAPASSDTMAPAPADSNMAPAAPDASTPAPAADAGKAKDAAPAPAAPKQ